jgi:hypothetical protein
MRALTFAAFTAVFFYVSGLAAQDVPGIENCMAEKAMERRTGCMQSNINYLQQLIAKRAADYQQKLDAANQKLDAANSDIASLKTAVAKLRSNVDDLQAVAKKAADPKPK